MTNDAYDRGDNEDKNDTQRDKMTDVQNRQKQHRKQTKYIAFMQRNKV